MISSYGKHCPNDVVSKYKIEQEENEVVFFLLDFSDLPPVKPITKSFTLNLSQNRI